MNAVLQQPAVHTSAPAPDLFAGEATPAATPALRATCTLTFTGRLAHKPHVANKAIDGGHFVPVLVMDLQDAGAGHHNLVVHVPYTEATRGQAEAEAKRLKRDQVITVTTPLTDVRLFLPAASFSHDHP